MEAILFRTRSGPTQEPTFTVRPKRLLSDGHSSAGISYSGGKSTVSARAALHFQTKEKTDFPTNLRRASSDSELIRSEIKTLTRFRSLNRAFSSSIAERSAEGEDLSEQSVDLLGETEEDEGSFVLERKGLELGIPGVLPGNEVLVEELEFSGGGMGKGKKVGGGRGGDRSGNGDRDGIGAYYEEMLKANPGNPLLLRNYGNFLHQVVMDFTRAEEYYGRAILASPGDGEVLSLYGKLIWDTQKDRRRARGYFDQAVHACPDDCYVLGSYAHFLWDADEEEEEEEEEPQAAVATYSSMVQAR